MQTGIKFTNSLAVARFGTNQILLNGSGLAAGDVDGDGWCDLYLCRLGGSNALYRNLGNWRFQDITASAGVACAGLDSTGAALADLDGDGDLDLVVNSVGGGTHFFLNDGHAHFTEVQVPGGFNPGRGGMSVALGDLDGDGFLDVYVANYRTLGLMDMPNAYFTFKRVNGKQVVASVNRRPVTEPDLANRFIVTEQGGIEELGEPDVLFHNDHGTNFVPVPFTGGRFSDEDGKPFAQPLFDWSLSAMIRDIDQDGLPDIYVCCDFNGPDRVWMNRGDGRLQLNDRLAIRKQPLFSMGIDFADLNRDGCDDFVALDMLSRDRAHRMNFLPDRRLSPASIGEIESRPQYARTMVFLNRCDHTYAEIAPFSGLEATDWSWCPVFLDVDLDGWEDLLVTNGNERDSRNMDVVDQLRTLRRSKPMTPAEILESRRIFPPYHTARLAFRNRHELTFEEVGRQWGFDDVGVSHGMALADLDNDGDLDVIVNNLNAAVGLYRNDAPAPRVAVRLKAQAPNTQGIGARITVRGGPVVQSQEMICGGRYLSSDQPMRVFAAGTLTNALTIEVVWRSGRRSVVEGAQPNRIYEIDETASVAPVSRPSPAARLVPSTAGREGNVRRTSGAPPCFEDVSHLLNHRHTDEPFDDFARQPLLPNKLSQLGPGVTWCDLNGDGWDDLIVGSGKGGTLAVFRNDGRGGFVRWEESPLAEPVTRDQTSVLPWRNPAGQWVLLQGSANYEDGLATGAGVRSYDLAGKKADDVVSGQASSTGPLALADYDGDGNLDLFVGGRCLPEKYPQAASSLLLRNVTGRFEVDAENSRQLAAVGLVSGAVFSDLDGDGDPDLILACEWGPVRIFRNDAGKLRPWDWTVTFAAPSSLNPQPSTLNQLTGWWNGVATGDFDGDGRMDIVVSNWGRNTRYQNHRTRPLQVVYGDLDGDGTEDLIEAHFDESLRKYVPERLLDFYARAMPFLREKYPTHQAYATASVEEMLGERMQTAKRWEANWLDSTVFLNRGGSFAVRPLPAEAQFAPAFGIAVNDFDGDGLEDIFLSQNFFATQVETPRYDAGRGLWVRGDGRGSFNAIDGTQSGIKVYGEQRGCAVADYDGDGRVDLAVAQNGAATRLYRNRSAQPGLRVRLAGPPGNPNGVGATLRLVTDAGPGPLRELHAGSGYWSQDSAVAVLAAPTNTLIRSLWVRWPGGRVTTSLIPGGAKEVRIDSSGAVQQLR